jgi:hypothetical protein
MYRARSRAASRSRAAAISTATVRAKRSGGWPGIVGPDSDATQTNNSAWTMSIAARQSMNPIAMRQ